MVVCATGSNLVPHVPTINEYKCILDCYGGQGITHLRG
jgi:hypothetical protein